MSFTLIVTFISQSLVDYCLSQNNTKWQFFFSPQDVDSYIHRSGRTGRAGRNGTCVMLYKPSQEYMIKVVENKAVSKTIYNKFFIIKVALHSVPKDIYMLMHTILFYAIIFPISLLMQFLILNREQVFLLSFASWLTRFIALVVVSPLCCIFRILLSKELGPLSLLTLSKLLAMMP